MYGPGPDLSFLPLIIFIGIPVCALIWFIVTQNKLVNLSNLIAESWSDVDTELRRRYDLIPNLVATVKAYAAHEQAIFEAVAKARSQAMASTGATGEHARDENELVHSLRQLFAVSEGYPTLKADGNFLQLQQELVNTEDRIQAARRFFNGNVRDYNNLVECFPSSMVASMFSYQRKEFFEIEDLGARTATPVGF